MKINVEIESIQKEGDYIVGTLSLDENFKKETFDLECIIREDNSGFEYAFLNGINLMTDG
ncbi:hypothetical protein [Alkalicoccus luteus]|uniref:hypothetical protein n=1 Tax=Alkalicoccus luteus TaxID=1237094 RepID=UPI004033867A